MMSCGEMAAKLRLAAERAKTELVIPTEELMVEVEARAKAAIGTYTFGWPPLKPETIAHKATGDSPLLETGALRDSIHHKAAVSPEGAAGLIYSNSEIAVYQELGTSRGIPPRSFLMQSLVHSIPTMGKLFGAFAEKIIAGV